MGPLGPPWRSPLIKAFYKISKIVNMSQNYFSCLSIKSYIELLFKSCSTTFAERQQQSVIKLEGQILTQQHLIRESEKKIADLDIKKETFVKQRKIADAKKIVMEKHKVMSKMKQDQGLLDYTQTLLDQINNTEIMQQTVSTLTEAQVLFRHIDAPKIYKKFDKLSNQYQTTSQEINNTNELIQDRMMDSIPNMGITDAELLAELEALESIPLEEPKETVSLLPVSTQTVPGVAQSATQRPTLSSLYAAAGFS